MRDKNTEIDAGESFRSQYRLNVLEDGYEIRYQQGVESIQIPGALYYGRLDCLSSTSILVICVTLARLRTHT